MLLSSKNTIVLNSLKLVFAALAISILASCAGDGPRVVSNTETSRLYVEEGKALLRVQDYSAALATLKRARPIETGDQDGLVALAVAADMTGDFRLADRAYAKLLPLSTDRVTIFNNMGYSFMLRGDLERAAEYLTEAARQDPDNIVVRNNLTMLRQVTML